MQEPYSNRAAGLRYRRVLVALLALFLVMWGSIAAILYLAAANANRQSIEESMREVAGQLEQYRDKLESQVKIFAYWEDGIDNLASDDLNRAWADREMGQYLVNDLGIDLWFVLNPAAQPSTIKSGARYLAGDQIPIGFRDLIQVQRAARRDAGPPPQPASLYVMVGEDYYLLSASALIIESRLVALNQTWTLAFGQPLTSIFRDIAINQGVELTLVERPSDLHSQLSLVLKGPQGQALAWVQWDIELAGDHFLAFIAPWVSCLFLLTLLLCGFLLSRVSDMYRKLRTSENRFRDAIDALPDGFVIYDSNDQLAAWNARYRQIYARSKAAINAGNDFENVIRYGFAHEQYRSSSLDQPGDTIEQRIQARVSAHRHPGGTFEQQLDDGRWIRVVERRMSDGGIVSFRYDISELKQRESELLEAKRVAERANDAKSRFLASVSHEVRTPLNALLGFLELLDDAPLPSEARSHIEIARYSGEHLLTIIDNLLDFSQIEAGSFDLRVHPFELGSVINSVAGMLRPLAEQRGLRLEVMGNLVCPDLLGDEARLRQVLLNLVCNGLKFTQAGGVVLHVEKLDSAEAHSRLRFSVKDTGVGINPGQVDAIFKPFFQAGGAHVHSPSGIGLGLPISQKILQSMGGHLGVSSSPGHGSEFSFVLQFSNAPALPRLRPSQEAPRSSPAAAAAGEAVTVLIADDVEPNRKLLEAMLRGSRYRTLFAKDGLEAVAVARDKRPDVILMDVSMPEMDGLQATKAIRHAMGAGRAPVIALTASAMEGDRERFLDAGMNDYLSKPVSKAALMTILARWAPSGSIPTSNETRSDSRSRSND